jgi:hypothetical protein
MDNVRGPASLRSPHQEGGGLASGQRGQAPAQVSLGLGSIQLVLVEKPGGHLLQCLRIPGFVPGSR